MGALQSFPTFGLGVTRVTRQRDSVRSILEIKQGGRGDAGKERGKSRRPLGIQPGCPGWMEAPFTEMKVGQGAGWGGSESQKYGFGRVELEMPVKQR